MSKIALIAKLTAAEGKIDRLRDAFDALVAAAEEEDGLEIYSVHTDTANEGVFYFYELYHDQAALDDHGQTDRMRAAMGAIGGLLGGQPEVTILSPMVAKGIGF